MHQFAVVRVVVDTPSAPLVHPRTVPNGVRALRVLARVAAALPAWAAARVSQPTFPRGGVMRPTSGHGPPRRKR